MQVDLTIPLGADPIFGAYSVMDMAALPGAPHSVAVSLATYTITTPARGVRIYDDGVPRSVWGGGSDIGLIAFGADSGTLYGGTTSVSPASLIKMKVDNTGVVQISNRWDAGGGPELRFLDNRLYTYTRVYDASTLADVGYFSFVGSWVPSTFPEAGTGRIYLLEAVSDGTGQNSKIWAADIATFARPEQCSVHSGASGVRDRHRSQRRRGVAHRRDANGHVERDQSDWQRECHVDEGRRWVHVDRFGSPGGSRFGQLDSGRQRFPLPVTTASA
jgi:hypothetical protein